MLLSFGHDIQPVKLTHIRNETISITCWALEVKQIHGIMQSQRHNCLLIYFKITSRHWTITLPSHFFNKLGKRRRNANESTRFYQLTLTSHITRLFWEYCVKEQKWQLCPVPKEPGETLCLSCQGFAYQHSCKPQTDPKSPCFIQTLSSFPTSI